MIQEEELRRHNKPTDAWISFNGFVYDITAYVEKHPPCTGRVCFVIALCVFELERNFGSIAS